MSSHASIYARYAPFLVAGLLALSLLPIFAHAQTQASASSSAALRVAIQNAVLKDPSSANIPPAQLNSLIDALTQQAQAQGITPQEINYRPGQPVAGPAIASSATCRTAFCTVATAFGFGSPLGSVLFISLIVAGILILVVGWLVLRHHRIHGHI